jgi:hypothetical protein
MKTGVLRNWAPWKGGQLDQDKSGRSVCAYASEKLDACFDVVHAF